MEKNNTTTVNNVNNETNIQNVNNETNIPNTQNTPDNVDNETNVDDGQNSPDNIDREGTPWTERKLSHPERIVTIGTSCSGIGAIERALINMGVKTRIEFAGDIDKNVKKSYMANYDPKTYGYEWHNDMFKFDATPYKGKLSIFCAGICCQTFSKAGKQEGVEDELRGQLFRAFCRIVRETDCRIWILENVDNLLISNKGKDWETIKPALDELGYDIHYQVLNAKDYGAPQSRNRVFIIGFKEKTDFLFPAPIKPDKSIIDILESDKITSGIRQITGREALRLQGFDDDFDITAVTNKNSIYNQAGNSIAIPVLQAILTQMDITKYGFDK